jgi:four helix bundle protein
MGITEDKGKKRRELEERTYTFAKAVIDFIEHSPRTISGIEIAKQVVRSAGSVGANYIEANESLGKKDFLLRLRICRKEAKETVYWLKLIPVKQDIMISQRDTLLQEATD